MVTFMVLVETLVGIVVAVVIAEIVGEFWIWIVPPIALVVLVVVFTLHAAEQPSDGHRHASNR